jgi:hypothetical protein
MCSDRGDFGTGHDPVGNLAIFGLPYALTTTGGTMKTAMQYFRAQQEKGAIGYILLWAMGVPISVLAVIFLLRGCT